MSIRDPSAFVSVGDMTRNRFGLKEITVVGDHGTIARVFIEAMQGSQSTMSINPARAPQIQTLMRKGALKLGDEPLFYHPS
ncbi:hypothetical protein SAMN02745225_00586 [Ferrithrix thermotolerans DSM 19514]|uniref:Uncharacterized protein n=1 Tax=Ferrithrix thermotolerans DSM 19514 TaxID=1121881 RepID=A0A1M4TEZ6_9ACTN|nr:hypothetical protein [Ferrithrix thermotolerans]SHE43026.1 hypothetical protein SAMN02745225_00586 [Ferrithrix thermotolerans DSM 19514]